MKKCPVCGSKMDEMSSLLQVRLTEALAPVDGWDSPIVEGHTCICGVTLLIHSAYSPDSEDAQREQTRQLA